MALSLVVMLALFLGIFPGAHQALKAAVLRHDAQIHQFQAGAEQQGQRAAGDQGETGDARQRDPVVLQLGGLLT